MKNYNKILNMIYLNNYCTDFMFLVLMVCNMIFIYNIVSHNFQFPFSFQDITLVCWNSSFNHELYSYISTKRRTEKL